MNFPFKQHVLETSNEQSFNIGRLILSPNFWTRNAGSEAKEWAKMLPGSLLLLLMDYWIPAFLHKQI